MTQLSRPQAGLFPADGDDCGAYTANEWATVLIAQNRSGGMMVTGAAAPPGLPATQLFPNVGVYYAVADRLEVTSPAQAQVSIATGAGIVDGRVFTNDTAITAAAVAIPAGAANSRIDMVVLRQNYTNATYTPTYVPSLTVPANTARITVISGAEAVGPVAPTLTQDEDRTTYWDIPLGQYQIIHTTGVISALTDLREWVDATTKRFFVQFPYGVDETTPAVLAPDTLGDAERGLIMPVAVISEVVCHLTVPNDFISSMTITPVVISAEANDAVLYSGAQYGTDTEGIANHVAASGKVTRAMLAGAVREFLDGALQIAPTSATVGDVITAYLQRDGTDGDDDVTISIWAQGVIVDYLGYGRR